MQIRPLRLPDAFEITPVVHEDDRGSFFEWFKFDQLEAVLGHKLDLRQANGSVSKRGVVRGIHFADVPPGQAKYVTLSRGRGISFVVDITDGSPTYAQWDSVQLDDVTRRAVYVPEGYGHCFVALEDDAILNYLVTATYNPGRERDVSVLDPEIGLEFPSDLGEPLYSAKDRAAPTLAQLREQGLLPTWDVVSAYRESLRGS